MNTNTISNISASNAYQNYAKTKNLEKAPIKSDSQTANTPNQKGVVYEPNTELIAKLKSDAEARTAQFQNLVRQLMTQQGETYGQANDMWKFLAGGNFTVDSTTKAQAEAEIAEDGYWGVEQTSQRIIDFATALTGGDPSKVENMREAFQKGFDLATKTWGKELPDISQRTYDAVMEKFDKLAGKKDEKEDE